MKRFQSLLLALALIGLASNTLLPAAQQRFGALSGKITDESGANVAGATVTARPNFTGDPRTTTSGADGVVQIRNLPPGPYIVTVDAPGFARSDPTNVFVTPGTVSSVDFTLKPVSASESVTVVAEPPASQTQGQQVGKIGGAVMDRVQEDGDRSVLIDFDSLVPITEVGWRLSKELFGVVKAAHVPEGWTSGFNDKTGRLTISRGPNGLPLFEIKARYVIPKSWATQLDEFLKKGAEFDFISSLGDLNLNYGSRLFEVKKLDPVRPVTLVEAVEDLPKTARRGDKLSFTPKEAYGDGTWTLDHAGMKIVVKVHPPGVNSSLVEEDREILRLIGNFMTTEQAKPYFEMLARERSVTFPISPFLLPGVQPILTYVNAFGETVVRGALETTFLPPLDLAGAAPRLFDCTPKLFQGDNLCVCGYFPNLFSRQQLLLDGKRLNHPLSGSTDIVVFKPQNLAPGKHVITWDVPAFDSFFNPEPKRTKPPYLDREEFVVLAIRGSIDRNLIHTKEGTKLTLWVIGTEEKIDIELVNQKPDIIDLEGGVRQVVRTSGGKDNKVERKVKGLAQGDFDVVYKLTLPPCPCQPERISEFMPLSGVLKTPDRAPGDQTSEARPDCELIMLEYTKLSIEYGKLQADLKRGLDGCDRLDDGTIAGRDLRDECRAIVTAIHTVNSRVTGAGLEPLREKMLALLSRYRSCREGKPAANQ